MRRESCRLDAVGRCGGLDSDNRVDLPKGNLMTNEDRSTHEMVMNLHVRFDRLDERMEGLHEDHVALTKRVDQVEKEVASDIAHLDKHEAEACLREVTIIQRLDHMAEKQNEGHRAFVAHANREDQDRKWIRNMLAVTLLAVLGTLGTMLLTKVFGG
jgi:hypothetical protein